MRLTRGPPIECVLLGHQLENSFTNRRYASSGVHGTEISRTTGGSFSSFGVIFFSSLFLAQSVPRQRRRSARRPRVLRCIAAVRPTLRGWPDNTVAGLPGDGAPY